MIFCSHLGSRKGGYILCNGLHSSLGLQGKGWKDIPPYPVPSVGKVTICGILRPFETRFLHHSSDFILSSGENRPYQVSFPSSDPCPGPEGRRGKHTHQKGFCLIVKVMGSKDEVISIFRAEAFQGFIAKGSGSGLDSDILLLCQQRHAPLSQADYIEGNGKGSGIPDIKGNLFIKLFPWPKGVVHIDCSRPFPLLLLHHQDQSKGVYTPGEGYNETSSFRKLKAGMSLPSGGFHLSLFHPICQRRPLPPYL